MKTKKELKKKESNNSSNSNTTITMSTISDKLATDSNYYSPPVPPKPSTICGIFTVHKVALFGLSFNAIFLFCFYVYALIRLLQKQPSSYVEITVIASILISVYILLTFLFVLAVFRARPKLLLPYIILNTVLFFAYAGAIIGSTVTVADEIREEVNGEDRTYRIVDIILLKMSLIFFGLFQLFMLYSYILTFLDVRRLSLFHRR